MCRFNFTSLRFSLPLTLAFVLSTATNLLTPTHAHATASLDTLRPGHPRLFLHNDELPALKHTIETDPYVHARFEGLRSYADTLLTMPPKVYTLGGDEHTLLFTARDIEGRVFALAGVYRITGERRYADRAIQEMLAAAAFPDWYPTHFLDTGEMTAAMGVGYDWLYDVLTPEQRGTIKAAITKKGIDPWLVRISDGTATHFEHNNWNQVCNGGEAVGALAIADEEPARARAILESAVG